MEGPRDKTVTFIAVAGREEDGTIPARHEDRRSWPTWAGKTLGRLLEVERQATAGALAARGRLNCTITVPAISARAVWARCCTCFELATAYAGELYEVDAFDQPGVELGKQFAYAMLGPPGQRRRPGRVGRAAAPRSALAGLSRPVAAGFPSVAGQPKLQVIPFSPLRAPAAGAPSSAPDTSGTPLPAPAVLEDSMTQQTLSSTQLFGGAVSVTDGVVHVHDPAALQSADMDRLVHDAVFGEPLEREQARWLIWEIGQAVGVRAASIHDLYMARGRGECGGFTVPAINVRGASYDTARAIFRQAIALDAGAFMLEIARSEIAYTEQRPAEYVSVMLAAALREGFTRPGVHPGRPLPGQRQEVRRPIPRARSTRSSSSCARPSRPASTTSTSTPPRSWTSSQPTLDEQQRRTTSACVEITRDVRAAEPRGVTISVGGEIGEVGTENSTARGARGVHGRLQPHARGAGARHGRAEQDLRAVGHVARRHRARRRLHRRRGARPRHAGQPLA